MRLGNRGNVLMMVLIAIPIAGVLTAAISTILHQYQSQVASLSRKLEATQAEMFLTQVLADSAKCAEIFSTTTVNLSGLTVGVPSSQPVSIPELKTANGMSYLK